jgi:hypothetical protein
MNLTTAIYMGRMDIIESQEPGFAIVATAKIERNHEKTPSRKENSLKKNLCVLCDFA